MPEELLGLQQHLGIGDSIENKSTSDAAWTLGFFYLFII